MNMSETSGNFSVAQQVIYDYSRALCAPNKLHKHQTVQKTFLHLANRYELSATHAKAQKPSCALWIDANYVLAAQKMKNPSSIASQDG